jgi:hypothetical protein
VVEFVSAGLPFFLSSALEKVVDNPCLSHGTRCVVEPLRRLVSTQDRDDGRHGHGRRHLVELVLVVGAVCAGRVCWADVPAGSSGTALPRRCEGRRKAGDGDIGFGWVVCGGGGRVTAAVGNAHGADDGAGGLARAVLWL